MTEQLTIDQQTNLRAYEKGMREFHPKRHHSELCRQVFEIFCRRLCEEDEPRYRRVMAELRVPGTHPPALSDEERALALQADRYGEYGEHASRVARLCRARDAALQALEELRARPAARPADVRSREGQLASYERELLDLRLQGGCAIPDLLGYTSGGDAVGPEYLGYIVALLGGEQVGRLDYTYLEGELGIRYVQVDPGCRREGIATALLGRLREDEPLAEVFFFGDFLTDEGRAWVEHHGLERRR